MIVDTHVHVVSPDEERYLLCPAGIDQGTGAERRPAAWYRDVPISTERLLELMAATGVERALLVQAMGAYSYDNRYAVDSAARYPDRFSSVCIVDVESEPQPAATLRDLVEKRGARGVRLFTVTQPEGQWLDQQVAEPVWECAASLGLPVVVTILARQIPKLVSVLRRFPALPVALDHCGFPDLRGGSPYARAQALFELADLDNLRLKVSSLVLGQLLRAGDEPRAFVKYLAERFGAARLMWGSDYSQTHFRDYAGLVELGRDAASGLSSRDQEAFLGASALEMWPELRAPR